MTWIPVHYRLACAYEGLVDPESARRFFEMAAEGDTEPVAAMYYNDQPADLIYDQGLALRKLARDDEAERIFRTLVDFAVAHLDDEVTMDYFAVSLPNFLVFEDDLGLRNRVHCHYIAGLGHLGLDRREQARVSFKNVLDLQADHPAALLL